LHGLSFENPQVSQIAPRYLIQHWHFRYNCVFLGGSTFFFAFYCFATLSTPVEGQVNSRDASCLLHRNFPETCRTPLTSLLARPNVSFLVAIPHCHLQVSRSWKLLLGYTLLLFLDLLHRSILLIRMHAFLSRCVCVYVRGVCSTTVCSLPRPRMPDPCRSLSAIQST